MIFPLRESVFVDHFLRPIVEDIKSYVKYTTYSLNIIKSVDNLPVTFDVGSLYTNIPNEEGINACTNALQTNRHGTTKPSNRSFIELL